MSAERGWDDASAAAALLAIDPGLGGAVLRSRPSPARDAWLSALRAVWPVDAPMRRAPAGIDDEQMFGGLDLAATLAAGRPIARQGLLDVCAGGVLVLAMAERLAGGLAARIGERLDRGSLTIVALDEGVDEDERTPAALGERTAFHLSLEGVRAEAFRWSRKHIDEAQARLLRMAPAATEEIELVCRACAAFDIGSARAAIFALRAARASAALSTRPRPAEEDWALAARLVLSPRARASAPQEEPPAAAPEDERGDARDDGTSGLPAEVMVEAVRSALPSGFLDTALQQPRQRAHARQRGDGALAKSGRRGRPAGARPGALRTGDRLDLVATLRAAAPWQALRRAERPDYAGPIQVRRSDFRIRRHVQRLETTIVLVVDASGSTALQRLAEAKGAAQTLLADAYVTRARVAVIAFRERAATVLLAPTRSLARAKRALADLPGGGATPLAAAIDAASLLAQSERAKARSPLVVLLSDGRGNINRAGEAHRDGAERDAHQAARALAGAGLSTVFIDTSPRTRPQAAALATAMGARYVLLPRVDAGVVAEIVNAHAPARR